MEYTKSNYASDRSTNFRHHIPDDIAPVRAMTVEQYVANEKAKQMSRLRDWHLNARDSQQINAVSLRENFSNSRNYTPTAAHEIEHHKFFLVVGALAATVGGAVLMFCH